MITCECGKKIDSVAEMGDHIADKGHQEYKAEDGLIVPTEIQTLLMAGAKFCNQALDNGQLCWKKFTNNYRFAEHVIQTGHLKGDTMGTFLLTTKNTLDKLEKEWFYGRSKLS